MENRKDKKKSDSKKIDSNLVSINTINTWAAIWFHADTLVTDWLTQDKRNPYLKQRANSWLQNHVVIQEKRAKKRLRVECKPRHHSGQNQVDVKRILWHPFHFLKERCYKQPQVRNSRLLFVFIGWFGSFLWDMRVIQWRQDSSLVWDVAIGNRSWRVWGWASTRYHSYEVLRARDRLSLTVVRRAPTNASNLAIANSIACIS